MHSVGNLAQMHRQLHLVMYYVFAQRFVCAAYVL